MREYNDFVDVWLNGQRNQRRRGEYHCLGWMVGCNQIFGLNTL